MLRVAARTGTTGIVATPHANSEFPYDSARVLEAYHALRGQAHGILNVHLACDFHLLYDNIIAALAAPEKYTINNNHQYLMVELPDFLSTSLARDALTQLLNARFIPIITHPERNISLQSRPRELESWVHRGVLVQITAQSFTGRFGAGAKRSADHLLRARLVHFIASDAHDCIDRPPDLSPAYKYVLDRRGCEEADTAVLP